MALISYRQLITQSIGTIVYDDTTDDTLLMFNIGAPSDDPVEILFPADPIEGQIFGLTTRQPISDITLTPTSGPIIAPVTSLTPDTPVFWFFASENNTNRWFRHP